MRPEVKGAVYLVIADSHLIFSGVCVDMNGLT